MKELLRDTSKIQLASMLVATFLLCISLAYVFHCFGPTNGFDPKTNEDIVYIYRDSVKVANFENPYRLILGQSLEQNTLKYCTYLPGFFLLSAIVVNSGAEQFEDWLLVWKWSSFFIFALVGTIITWNGFSKGIGVGLFAGCLWFFARWSLYSANVGQIDPFAVLFLAFAILSLDKNYKIACVLLGISLAIKQIALLVVPLFVISQILKYGFSFKKVFLSVFLIFVIPVLVSIPFFIDSPEGFLKSILFSVTRLPTSHLMAYNVDQLIEFNGKIGKLLTLFSLIYIYFCYAKRTIKLEAAIAFCFIAWVSFHPIYFMQYAVWPLMALLITLPNCYEYPTKLKSDPAIKN